MKQMGELIVDHRASPGLPENVARWAGYDVKRVGEGKVWETKTLCCSHCNACVVPNPERVRPRAICMECDNLGGHYICDGCDFTRHEAGYVHTPHKKVVDQLLTKAARELMGSPTKLIIP